MVYIPLGKPVVTHVQVLAPNVRPRCQLRFGYWTQNSYTGVGQPLELAVNGNEVPAVSKPVLGVTDAEVQPVRLTVAEPIESCPVPLTLAQA